MVLDGITKTKTKLDFISLSFIVLSIVAMSYTLTLVNLAADFVQKTIIAIIFMISGLALGSYEISKIDTTTWFISAALATAGIILVNMFTNTVISGATLTSTALLAIYMAVAEETFFRGFLQSLFTDLTGPMLAILLQSGVWTLYHATVYASQPGAFMIIFLSGIILGLAKNMTQSLSPTITAHVLINFIACLGG